jgi:hypothetical protein
MIVDIPDDLDECVRQQVPLAFRGGRCGLRRIVYALDEWLTQRGVPRDDPGPFRPPTVATGPGVSEPAETSDHRM